MVETFIAICCRRVFVYRQKVLKLLCQQNRVEHFIFCAAGMDAVSVDDELCTGCVEVLVFHGTGIAAVHSIGKVGTKAGNVKQSGTLADLLVRGKADAQLAAAHPQVQEGFCGMTIKGVIYDEKKTAGERLVLACSELPNAEEKVIGSYRGFELSLRFDTFRSEYQALLKGQRKYTVPLGTDPLGNIIRLDNSLNNFPERITAAENELTTLHQQQAAAQIEVEKPFPQEEELAEKSARLAELNAQLDVDEKNHEPEQDEGEKEQEPRRSSVLAALEEKADKVEPIKPFKSYLDKDGDAR